MALPRGFGRFFQRRALAVGQEKTSLNRNRPLDAPVARPAPHDHTGTRGPAWGTFPATQWACGVLGQCPWCLSAISPASTDLRARPPISRPTSSHALRCACAGAPWLAAPIRGSPPPLALSARRARHRHGARHAGSTRRVGGLRPGGDRVRRHRGSAPRGRAPSHTQNALFAALRSSSAAGSDCDLTAVALPWPRRSSARSTRGMERAKGLERRPLPMHRRGFV